MNPGDKFCLLVVDDCVGAPATDIQLSDSTWALTKLPLELSPTWQRWIGERRSNAFQRANFLLLRTLPNAAFGNLDDEHEQLKRDVRDAFCLLQISGPLRYQTATLVLGSADSYGSIISKLVELRHFYETRSASSSTVTPERLEEAIAARDVRAQMRGKSDFGRFKRGLRILNDGLSEIAGSERLHQFLRAIEALCLPETGKTRRQLISRAKLMTTGASGTGFVLGQLFDMRSDVEHVHELTRSIQYLPQSERENVALLRTRQAEVLACLAYRKILSDSTLRQNYVSDETIQALWHQSAAAIKASWGHPLNLLAVS